VYRVLNLSLLILLALFFWSLVFFNPSQASAALTGDVNTDGKVDIVDIGIVIDNYARTPIANLKADINSDGSVNIIDIGIIIDNYGKTPAATSTPSAGTPFIMAASDIICDGLTPTGSSCLQGIVSDLFVSQKPNAALLVGDICHTPSTNCFNNYYAPTYGRFKSITHPTTGNHEYLASGASYYFDYFNGAGNANGPAGERGKGYYSFDVGSWHIVALNSQCSEAGGCGSGSPQYTWLQNDLTAHSTACTLAFYHIPVFSSGGRANNNMAQIFSLLHSKNVDIVLNGHDHIYERFAPQAPGAKLDNSKGIRQFIVGTGGANHTNIASVAPNSEVRNTTSFGALKLTLHNSSYDWQFIPVTGSFTDSGSANCH
jgi:hypothetical protein